MRTLTLLVAIVLFYGAANTFAVEMTINNRSYNCRSAADICKSRVVAINIASIQLELLLAEWAIIMGNVSHDRMYVRNMSLQAAFAGVMV